MTIRVDLTTCNTQPEAGPQSTVERDAVQLTAAELDHVTGAGSKPGASAGTGVGKPGATTAW
jgi:hypothetical protein